MNTKQTHQLIEVMAQGFLDAYKKNIVNPQDLDEVPFKGMLRRISAELIDYLKINGYRIEGIE